MTETTSVDGLLSAEADMSNGGVHLKAVFPTDPISGGRFVKQSTATPTVTQGVAFDGTFYYTVSGTTLYKYDQNWSLVASRDAAADIVATTSHISAPLALNGFLYAPVHNDPRAVIARWNLSDLSFVGQQSVVGAPDMASAALAWDATTSEFLIPGYYSDELSLQRFDASFNYLGNIPTDIVNPQGVLVLGERIYVHGDLPALAPAGGPNGRGLISIARDGSDPRMAIPEDVPEVEGVCVGAGGSLVIAYRNAALAYVVDVYVPSLLVISSVRFFRGADIPVRSGAPALAPGGVARAYDREAPCGVVTSWYCVPEYTDGTVGAASQPVELTTAQPIGVRGVWVKSISNPALSVQVTATGVPELSYEGRQSSSAVRGSAYPLVAVDTWGAATGTWSFYVPSALDRAQLQAVLTSGVVLVQTRPEFDFEDMFIVCGTVGRARAGTVLQPDQTITADFTEVARPPAEGSTLYVPGKSWADFARAAGTWAQARDVFGTWAGALDSPQAADDALAPALTLVTEG